MQAKLFYTGEYLYWCVNPDCFYDQSIIEFEDILWREAWNSDLEDVVPIAMCPACATNLWGERSGKTLP